MVFLFMCIFILLVIFSLRDLERKLIRNIRIVVWVIYFYVEEWFWKMCCSDIVWSNVVINIYFVKMIYGVMVWLIDVRFFWS